MICNIVEYIGRSNKMIGNPLGIGYAISNQYAARERFRQEFIGRGLEYTRAYLDSFGRVSRFLAEYSPLSRESNSYHGAKMALEEMLRYIR